MLLLVAASLPFPMRAETPKMLQPGTMEARVAACTHCHGAEGRAGPDGFYPRIAGKPAGYLLAQLIGFRDGGRNYEPMRHLLEGLSDDYLAGMAEYFADRQLPYAPPSPAGVPLAELQRGRTLAESGDLTRQIPACIACHGESLSGMEPGIPGLLGLPRDYIAAQLGSWRIGLRHAPNPDCMADISLRLTPADVAAVSAWLASRPVQEPYVPAEANSLPLPMECGAASPVPPVDPPLNPSSPAAPGTEPDLELGRYLSLAANCAGCHTVTGGAPFAGGAPIHTEFGTLYGPNITPSREHGIGNWTADDFWNAMHHGKAPDASPYYPAFPYPQYTRLTRTDTDALYAYLMAQPPAETARTPHTLRFPYNQRSLLRLWRMLYFKPGPLLPDPSQSAVWHRGRYLVEGAGHCAACHTPRNRWAASELRQHLQGSVMMESRWFATALTHDAAGLGNWSEMDIVHLLSTGISDQGTAAGPMASVVSESTQHLTAGDLSAMASYLKSLPPGPAAKPSAQPADRVMATGSRLYEQHCAACHKDTGKGAPPHWPPLAGNTSVLAPAADNILQLILKGGYAPTTTGNPQPHGMPPFHGLNDSDVAAVATFIRNSWGNRAGSVSSHHVTPLR